MTDYAIKPLGPDTWEAFAQLAERHKGKNHCVMRKVIR